MSTKQDQTVAPQKLFTKKAALWFLKLHSADSSPKSVHGLSTWLSQNLKHRDEYEAVESSWEIAGELENDPDIMKDLAECDRLIDQYQATRISKRKPRKWFQAHYKYMAIAASLCVVTILSLALLATLGTVTYQTAVGEQRLIALSDGSHVTLNTNTHLLVKYSRGKRRIDLLQGEAYFKVKKDANRPFEVFAGDRLTRALGTEFNVQMDDKKVTVVVVEGKVAVESQHKAPSDKQPTPTLTAEKSISYWSDGSISNVQSKDVARIKHWQEGKLYFKRERLVDSVEEFNRYTSKKLVIGSDAIKDLPINGIFRISDVEAFLYALNEVYQIQAVKGSGVVILTSKTDA